MAIIHTPFLQGVHFVLDRSRIIFTVGCFRCCRTVKLAVILNPRRAVVGSLADYGDTFASFVTCPSHWDLFICIYYCDNRMTPSPIALLFRGDQTRTRGVHLVESAKEYWSAGVEIGARFGSVPPNGHLFFVCWWLAGCKMNIDRYLDSCTQ